MPLVSLLQSTPQIKARLPSSATACYALAVSSDGKVFTITVLLLYPENGTVFNVLLYPENKI